TRGVVLKEGRAVHEALCPIRPFTRRIDALDRRDRRAARSVKGFFDRPDLRGGDLEDTFDSRSQFFRREFWVGAYHKPIRPAPALNVRLAAVIPIRQLTDRNDTVAKTFLTCSPLE